jgi:hypothetical protein
MERSTPAVVDCQQGLTQLLSTHTAQHRLPRKRTHRRALLQHAHRATPLPNIPPLGIPALPTAQVQKRRRPAPLALPLPPNPRRPTRLLEKQRARVLLRRPVDPGPRRQCSGSAVPSDEPFRALRHLRRQVHRGVCRGVSLDEPRLHGNGRAFSHDYA